MTAIPVLFAIYLAVFGLVPSFMSYCYYGLKEFNAFSNMDAARLDLVKWLAIIPVAYIAIILVADRKTDKKMLLYFASLLTACTIPDQEHIVLLSTPLMMYTVSNFCQHFNIKQVAKPIATVSTIGVIIAAAVVYGSESTKYEQYQPACLISATSLMQNVKEVKAFIDTADKPVYIINSDAVLYDTYAGRYLKDWSCLNGGNLGKNGKERIMDDIKSTDGYFLLENAEIGQMPKEFIECVKETKQYTGQVGNLAIYTTAEENIG